MNGWRGTAARSDCARQSMSMNYHATLLTQLDTKSKSKMPAWEQHWVLHFLRQGTFKLKSHMGKNRKTQRMITFCRYLTLVHSNSLKHTYSCSRWMSSWCGGCSCCPCPPQRLLIVMNINVHELKNTEALAFYLRGCCFPWRLVK